MTNVFKKNTEHIDAGVQYCSDVNNHKGFWASMEVIPQEDHDSIVRVFVGTALLGKKYTYHQVIEFYIDHWTDNVAKNISFHN